MGLSLEDLVLEILGLQNPKPETSGLGTYRVSFVECRVPGFDEPHSAKGLPSVQESQKAKASGSLEVRISRE